MNSDAPQAPPRRDAARNRAQILDAARRMVADGHSVQLNAVAREADVGVGTVYRHFATVDELLETLVLDRFRAMTTDARRAAEAPHPVPAFRAFLCSALAVYIDDEVFASVAATPQPALEETQVARAALLAEFGRLLQHVGETGSLRPSISAADAMALICGIAYAAKLAPGRSSEGAADRYLGALLDGLLLG
jgi:AcrR family transcriptional regulator